MDKWELKNETYRHGMARVVTTDGESVALFSHKEDARRCIEAVNALSRPSQWMIYEDVLPERGKVYLIRRGHQKSVGRLEMEMCDDWTELRFPTWVGSRLQPERLQRGDVFMPWPEDEEENNDA